MLSRPSDNGHTPFGDIFCSESPDLVHWGRHRHVMGTRPWSWSRRRSAPARSRSRPPRARWLIYHGDLTSCNGFVYSMGAALLDLDEPWHVIARPNDYLLSPQVAVRAGRRRAELVFPLRGARRRGSRPAHRLLRRRRHRRLHGARPPLRAAHVRPLVEPPPPDPLLTKSQPRSQEALRRGRFHGCVSTSASRTAASNTASRLAPARRRARLLKIASAGVAVAGFGALSLLVRSSTHTGSTASTTSPTSTGGSALELSSRISQEGRQQLILRLPAPARARARSPPSQSSSPPQASTHTS